MSRCSPCETLELSPLRPVAPTSFERSFASDITSGFVRATYKCGACGTFWRWCAPDGWERAFGAEEAVIPTRLGAIRESRI